MFQYSTPVSPHLAVGIDGQEPPKDGYIVDLIHEKLTQLSAKPQSGSPSWAFVETAGGVMSPGPSGTPQADIYRPLRLPGVLVGDSKLGGVSSTISAYESLRLRGIDTNILLIFQDLEKSSSIEYQNWKFLEKYFEEKRRDAAWKDSVPHVVSLPHPPPVDISNKEKDVLQMQEYYEYLSSLKSPQKSMQYAIEYLETVHQDRIHHLREMTTKASETVWYPFSQHSKISPQTILAIDSAHGDFFQAVTSTNTTTTIPSKEENNIQDTDSNSCSLLGPYFDASASWWTQGLGHGNADLALAAGYAAGRYGHVIFADTVHDGALKLAEKVLAVNGVNRLKRVFFSDNGSTGIEVALKMAFKAVESRYGLPSKKKDVGVIGLKRSYHGDTIGSMDACEQSPYNEQVHWYNGKGIWLEYPQMKVKDGEWIVEIPSELVKEGLSFHGNESESRQKEAGNNTTVVDKKTFRSLEEIFNFEARATDLQRYKKHIHRVIVQAIQKGNIFGAVIMEPILLGAGGMASM